MNNLLLISKEGLRYVLLILILPVYSLQASSKVWTGSVSDFWDEPGNWNPVGVPTASQEIEFFIFSTTEVIVIPSGVNAVAKTFDVICLASSTLEFTISSGGSLTLNGGGTTAFGLNISVSGGSNAIILNEGTLYIEDYTSRNVYFYNASDTSILFTNRGTLTIHECGTYGMHIDVTGSASTGAFNTFTNEGVLDISDGSQYAIYLSGRSGRPTTMINDGELIVHEMDYIVWANTEGPFVQTINGSIKGEGIVRRVAEVTLEAELIPGLASAGEIVLQASTGAGFDLSDVVMKAGVEGLAGKGLAGGHDHLAVAGNAILAGMQVEVLFEGGYLPSSGDSFDFLTVSGTVTGAPTFLLPPSPPGLAYSMVASGGIWTLNVSASFPVELVYLSAEQWRNAVLLSWQTASELNNEGFTVLRSTDGLAWESLGFVDGKGSTQQASSYSFYDRETIPGRTLYRLQQWDFDGQMTYSPVVELSIVHELQSALSVYPVPATVSLTIEGVKGQARLINGQGQVVGQFYTEGSPRVVSIEHLPSGLYYLQIETEDKDIVFARWIKE